MYIRPSYQAPRVPSQQMGVISANANNLIMILQKQAVSNRISIPEMYIGDEGAIELAAFLRGQPNITMIDLKGNNITPRGFIEIFDSLRQNFQIKSLNLEWNKIGIDIAGLESLYALMANNRSITHLDLRNNKINQTGAHIISNIIRNNTSLSSLDLRWNELNANGGRAILQAMEENGCLVGVELAGNGIPEEINQQIQQLVTNNRDGVPHTAQRRTNLNDSRRNSFHQQQQPDFNTTINDREQSVRFGGIQQFNQSYQQQSQQQPIQPTYGQSSRVRVLDRAEISQNIYSGYENLNMIQHLEIQIENERVSGLSLKESLTARINELKEGLNIKAQQRKQLEQELLARQHDNSILRSDHQRTEQDLKSYEHEKSKAARSMDEKNNLQEEKIRDTDKRLQSELLSMSDQNIREMRQLDTIWKEKCEELLRQVSIRSKKNDDTRIEMYRLMDDMVKSEFQSKDEAKEVFEKLKAAGFQQYQDQFHYLEKRMSEHEEKIMDNERRTSEKIRDLTNNFKQTQDRINEISQSIVKYKVENQDIALNNKEFEMYIERQRDDYEHKENLIENLKQELNKLKVKDQDTENTEKEIKRKIEDDFIQEHDQYNSLHDQNRDRINELEKALRESNEENLRLRASHQSLSDLLTSNTQTSTYQTFKDQKVM